MKKRYKQITSYERDLIAVHKVNGFTLSEIANIIGRHKSTISRELTRNRSRSNKLYLSNQAHKKSTNRKKNAAMKEELKCHQIRNFVKNKLIEGWTPEIIAGFLAIYPKKLKIRHESIYLYIYKKRPDLVQYLPRAHKKRFKRRTKSNKKINRIPNKVSIEQRPDDINNRSEFGHWESDAIVSKQSKVSLSVSVERVSKFVKIKKIKQNTANMFSKAVIRGLKPIPPCG